MDTRIKILFASFMVIVLAVITSVSYAYFNDGIAIGNEQVITSGTLSLNLADGDKVTLDNMVPGDILEKEFAVENTGTVNTKYDIYLSEELISNDGGYETEEPVQVPSNSEKIISQYEIDAGDTHHYILRITFVNDLNRVQNSSMGKVFEAKIQLNEYKDVETEVNIYLNNSIVDSLPEKTSTEYLVNESSCNNNASIEFDQDNWTYQIVNVNKNHTVCNLYFKSLYVTIRLENAKFSDNETEKTLLTGDSVTINAVIPSDYTESNWTGNTSCTGASDVGNTYYKVHHAYSLESWNVSDTTDSTITYTVPATSGTVTANIKDTTSEENKYECYSYDASWSSGYYSCSYGDSRSGSTCTHTSTTTTTYDATYHSEEDNCKRLTSSNIYNSSTGFCAHNVNACWNYDCSTLAKCKETRNLYMEDNTTDDYVSCTSCTKSGSEYTTTCTQYYKPMAAYYSCNSDDTRNGKTCTHTETTTSTYDATYHSGYYYCYYGGSRSNSTCYNTRSV